MKKFDLIETINSGNLCELRKIIHAYDLNDYVLNTTSHEYGFLYYLFDTVRPYGEAHLLAAMDIIFENKKIVQYLQSSIEHKTYSSFIFLAIGAENNSTEVIKGNILTKALSIKPYLYHIKHATNILEFACLFGLNDLFSILVNAGYDIHLKTKGINILSCAIRNENYDIVDFLIKENIDINTQIHDKLRINKPCTVLTYTILNEDEKGLEKLMLSQHFTHEMLKESLDIVAEYIKWHFFDNHLFEKTKLYYDSWLENQYLEKIIDIKEKISIKKEVKI
jgi:hypothetical protein